MTKTTTQNLITDNTINDSRTARQTVRRQEIADIIIAKGSMRIEDLSIRFNISLMTAHRDVDCLVKNGLFRKTRGTVSIIPTSLNETNDIYRSSQQIKEKKQIASAAINFIKPGQAIFLDDSTTIYQMASLLPAKVPLMVITNSLILINELKDVPDINLICLGGQFHQCYSAFIGHITVNEIKQLRADMAFVSLSAIIEGQAFHQSPEIVETKKAMLESSAKRILLVDHTKFERRALHSFMPLIEFDAVIVDPLTPPKYISKMRSEGINVIVADSC